MSALTENQIIDIVYSLYETDTAGWETDSSEYLSARNYCNAAISRWENYMNTTWRELWTTLTDAADGDKTLTAGTYDYDCPTNLKRPGSWVRTGSTPQFWTVVSAEEVGTLDSSTDYFCWFTGSIKDGFKLNFNPELTLTTGDTIYYEYYKTATQFSATSSTTEMADPYFIVYFVLSRFLKNDGEDFTDEANQSEEVLDNMRTANMTGVPGVPDQIQSLEEGFGL
jgi:hypothetical protein